MTATSVESIEGVTRVFTSCGWCECTDIVGTVLVAAARVERDGKGRARFVGELRAPVCREHADSLAFVRDEATQRAQSTRRARQWGGRQTALFDCTAFKRGSLRDVGWWESSR